MMTNSGNGLECDVLGCRISLSSNAGDELPSRHTPQSIVDVVLREAAVLRKKNPRLDDKQVAVLLALQFAQEKLSLEDELQNGFSSLHKSASQALQYIAEVCPKSAS